LLVELEGYGDYEIVDWKITIDDLIKEGRGVKSSPKEESNSSMTTKYATTFEHWRRVSGTGACLSQSWQQNLWFLAWEWCLESCKSNYHQQCNNDQNQPPIGTLERTW